MLVADTTNPCFILKLLDKLSCWFATVFARLTRISLKAISFLHFLNSKSFNYYIETNRNSNKFQVSHKLLMIIYSYLTHKLFFISRKLYKIIIHTLIFTSSTFYHLFYFHISIRTLLKLQHYFYQQKTIAVLKSILSFISVCLIFNHSPSNTIFIPFYSSFHGLLLPNWLVNMFMVTIGQIKTDFVVKNKYLSNVW